MKFFMDWYLLIFLYMIYFVCKNNTIIYFAKEENI